MVWEDLLIEWLTVQGTEQTQKTDENSFFFGSHN